MVVGLIHVNKSGSQDALNSIMGSRAFTAVPRAVLFVATDPDDETVRLAGEPKNNLGRTDLPTLGIGSRRRRSRTRTRDPSLPWSSCGWTRAR